MGSTRQLFIDDSGGTRMMDISAEVSATPSRNTGVFLCQDESSELHAVDPSVKGRYDSLRGREISAFMTQRGLKLLRERHWGFPSSSGYSQLRPCSGNLAPVDWNRPQYEAIWLRERISH